MSLKTFNKIIFSDPSYLPEIEEFVISAVAEYMPDHIKQNNLALSIAEAASNSILHGNKMDSTKKVIISVIIDDEYIQVKFKDEGAGFNPDLVPDPTKPENILKDSGRGIHIMKTFLDDLRYEFTPEGTEVTLVIKRSV